MPLAFSTSGVTVEDSPAWRCTRSLLKVTQVVLTRPAIKRHLIGQSCLRPVALWLSTFQTRCMIFMTLVAIAGNLLLAGRILNPADIDAEGRCLRAFLADCKSGFSTAPAVEAAYTSEVIRNSAEQKLTSLAQPPFYSPILLQRFKLPATTVLTRLSPCFKLC